MKRRVLAGVVLTILGCSGGEVPAPARAPLAGNAVPLRLALASSSMTFPLDAAAITASPIVAADGKPDTAWKPTSGAKGLFEFDRAREITGLRILPCAVPATGSVKLRLFDDDSDGAYDRKPWITVAVDVLADGWVGGELGSDATEAIAAELDVGDRDCVAEVEFLTSDKVAAGGAATRWRLARSVVLPEYVPTPAARGDVPTDLSEAPCGAGWTEGDGDEARVVRLESPACQRDGSRLSLRGTLDGAPWERSLDVVEVSANLRVYGGYLFTSRF